MRRYTWIAGCFVLMVQAGCGGHAGHDATMQHRFDDADRWSEHFDSPERDAWQKPQVVIEALGVQPEQFVADVGAGTGYFTVRLSRVVGRKGRVIAVDVEPAMVEFIRTRATTAGLDNIESILTRPNEPGLEPSSVDLVFICNTWHHIDDRLRYLGRLRGVLRPGGRVAIVDFKPGELPVGPPKGHKLAAETVVAEFTQAGWKLREAIDVLPYQYVLVFEP
jgi:ubiquinone/menaquinone biosynthesis C-methylase UbiE